jgi:hypothetical protein
METILDAQSVLDEAKRREEETHEFLSSQFKKHFVQFWEQNPLVTAVIWIQWTPYFNDGDPCTFSVSDPLFTNATPEQLENYDAHEEWFEGVDEENEDVWGEYVAYPSGREKLSALGLNIDSLGQLDTLISSRYLFKMLEEMFGDNMVVTATREGFSTSEYYQY